jgi:hypothetical protein
MQAEPFGQVLPLNSEMRTKKNIYLEQLKRLVALGDQRITILNGRFEDLAFALPDLVAETARERHLDRMQQFRQAAGGDLA